MAPTDRPPSRFDAIKAAITQERSRMGGFRGFCRSWCVGSFMVLSVACSVYLPTFAENGLGWILPWEHRHEQLLEPRSLDKLKEFAAPDSQLVYLFALDCSRSIEEQLPGIPDWYQTAARELEQSSYEVRKTNNPSAYAVATMGAAYLLKDLVDSDSSTTDDRSKSKNTYQFRNGHQFALWDVCGGGNKFYPPDDRMLAVDDGNVARAIRATQQRELADSDKTTDFLELLQQINKTYQIVGDGYGKPTRKETFIITVISDFLDDPKVLRNAKNGADLTPQEKEWLVQRRQRDIEKAVQSLFSGKIIVNLVVISSDYFGKGSVVSFLRDQAEWYRFNEISIMDDLTSGTDRLLYPVFRVSDPLTVYYERRSHVEGFMMLNVEAPGRVGLALAASSAPGSDLFALDYGYSGGHQIKPGEINGRLISGQPMRFEDLPANTSIQLRYSGPVPGQRQTLRISVESERRAYLVPIRFVPRLPASVSWWLLGLFVLMFLAGIGYMSPYPLGFWAGMVSPTRALNGLAEEE